MNDPSKALASFEKGRAIRQALVDANPRASGFQRDLAISLMMIGQFNQEAGQTAEAVAAYRKSLAILERLNVLAPIDQFNVALVHAGLAALAPDPGLGLSAADGRDEADQSMTWLRRALEMGYRPARSTLTSSRFSPLRSRRDFQLLIMDKSMPANPCSP